MSSKLVLLSTYETSDPKTTFLWEAKSLTSQKNFMLEYQTSTLTPSGIDTLVVMAYALEPGADYMFKLKLENSLGAHATGVLNITVGRNPWGGFVSIDPPNGTALSQTFVLSTGNWTDDPDSYPFRYLFQYVLETGNKATLSKWSDYTNFSTPLPLGYATDRGQNHILPIIGKVTDIYGDESSANSTAQVLPPSFADAMALAANQSGLLNGLLGQNNSDADVMAASVAVTAGASLISYVLLEGSDEDQEAVLDIRDSYLSFVTTASTMVASDSSIESTSIAIEALTSAKPNLMSHDSQKTVLDTVQTLANVSSSLGADSATSAGACVCTRARARAVGADITLFGCTAYHTRLLQGFESVR